MAFIRRRMRRWLPPRARKDRFSKKKPQARNYLWTCGFLVLQSLQRLAIRLTSPMTTQTTTTAMPIPPPTQPPPLPSRTPQ